MEHDPIAAPATPFGTSALAVVRTSGEGSIDLIAGLSESPRDVEEAAGHTLVYTRLIDPADRSELDEVVLGIYRKPRSYTGEDMAEIFCHGSTAGLRRILEVLQKNGFRSADPGEFTLRAFTAGKIDLTRAEAVHEVVTAQTGRAHEMALHRLSGSVEAEINEIKNALVKIMAAIAVQIDYPEEDTGEIPFPLDTVRSARSRLTGLVETYRTGRLYQEGARIALAGRPNAGKSSLFNRILRQDRSIVSETPGTTRDYIESVVDMHGIPVKVFDTAGLRAAGEAIEEEGISRTNRIVESADLVFYLLDGTEGIHEGDEAWIRAAKGDGRILLLWTKIDVAAAGPTPDGFVGISVPESRGISELIDEASRRLLPVRPAGDAVVIDSLRQRDLLLRATDALKEVERGVEEGVPIDAVSLDVRDAIGALGEITGEVTSADILDTVFGTFCLGK